MFQPIKQLLKKKGKKKRLPEEEIQSALKRFLNINSVVRDINHRPRSLILVKEGRQRKIAGKKERGSKDIFEVGDKVACRDPRKKDGQLQGQSRRKGLKKTTQPKLL